MWPSATVDSVMKQQEINLDFSRRQVMTIVNVTPDSFFAGSRTPDWLDVERRVRDAVEAGASVIDVGGYSSRSGADEVSPEEEWRRVDLGVGAVRSLSPDLPVSIDTFRSSVAARTIHKYGKVIINDISAGELDALSPMLEAAVSHLNAGGRLAVISFHSLEDRIIKKTMQELATGCTCPPNFPVCVCGKTPKIRLVSRKPIVSGDAELAENPRARSAKLRVAEKL